MPGRSSSGSKMKMTRIKFFYSCIENLVFRTRSELIGTTLGFCLNIEIWSFEFVCFLEFESCNFSK